MEYDMEHDMEYDMEYKMEFEMLYNMEYDIDSETDEEDGWEPEEMRQKVIVGTSLREAPSEEGQGGMTRFLLKSLLRKEKVLFLKKKKMDNTLPQEEAQEEKVPSKEKEDEPVNILEKEEETDIQEEKGTRGTILNSGKGRGKRSCEGKQEKQALILEKENGKDHQEGKEEEHDLTIKEAEEENVLLEEKEDNGSEGKAAVNQGEPGEMSYADMAKILPEQKMLALSLTLKRDNPPH
ncbi:nucleolar protein 58-like [Macrobrachium rosenbergii]|uniref:nucleolar protein 58-like n=1 Tax=Macrobrachium rosenbergii TaxID=79674 RepID=UPI0034D407A8